MDDAWTQLHADGAAMDSLIISRQAGYPGLFAMQWLDDAVKQHATHILLAPAHAQLYCADQPVGMIFPFNDARLYPAIRQGFDQVLALYPQLARWVGQEEGHDQICYRILRDA
ncbi:hypothetical protein [Herpetosiphon giganteus]|uniref:hypothetical protein n=1 Tax=Herpetosiphon giganteus TaxID=2029754 RepID=UPI00195808E2|nr:hypothetical protein [Herpetosiphon giganteus]MBM7846267.1 hypothetical protein [Herpetosiphon giganteus]